MTVAAVNQAQFVTPIARGGRPIETEPRRATFALVLALLSIRADPANAVAQKSISSMTSIDSYAACLVEKSPNKVAEALANGFDEKFEAALAALSFGPCSAPTAYLARQVRGALFESMYRKHTPKAGHSASNILQTWVPKLPASDPRAGWYVVSACLVDKAPGSTRALVRAKPGTTEKIRKFSDVAAVLPKCLPAGQQFKLSRSTLTGLIAETVYQIDFATQYGDRKRF